MAFKPLSRDKLKAICKTHDGIVLFESMMTAVGEEFPTALDELVRKDTLTTRGDIFVRDASTVIRLPLGAIARVLQSDGTDAIWQQLTSASISDFNEAAQDAALAALTDSAEIDWTYNDGAGTASASLILGAVNHDALLNFVADEHVPHSGVTLTAGAGLTGGGDISSSRSFAVGAGTGISVAADAVAVDLAASFPWTGPHSWDEQIQVVPGSAGTPSIASTGDPNTGLFWNGGDILSFSAGGSTVFALTPTIFRVVTQIQSNDGSAAAPAFSFDNDPDCGIFRQGVNAVGIATNGAEVGRFDASTTAGQTRFLVYDVDNGTLERVTVGAADSGGAGFKVLRIPN